MANVVSEQGGNNLNVELNLVPFIDLLSSLVLFLLITAVWMQISAIPASVSSHGRSSVAAADRARLSVRLTGAGYSLSWPDGLHRRMPAFIPKSGGEFDVARLTSALKEVSGRIAGASVAADDSVSYGNVVEAVDGVKSGAGVPVAISTE